MLANFSLRRVRFDENLGQDLKIARFTVLIFAVNKIQYIIKSIKRVLCLTEN